MGICSTWLSSKNFEVYPHTYVQICVGYDCRTQHFKKKEELEQYEYFVSLHDLVLLVPRQE